MPRGQSNTLGGIKMFKTMALALAFSGPLFGLAALAPTSAWAVPINFDEAVSGDLSSSNPVEFTLGVGENSFAGTVFSFFDPVGSGDLDSDEFFFTLAAGLRLVDARIEVTGVSDSSTAVTTEFVGDLGLFTNTGDLIAFTPPIDLLTATLPATSSIPGAVLPFGPGQFEASIAFVAQNGPGGTQDLRFDYRVTLSVAPAAIPEPGSLALFGLGLAGLGLAARRHRAPAAGPR